MKKKAKAIITPEKLYYDLLEINEEMNEEIVYFKSARDFLKKFELGEVDRSLLATIRTTSCLDREHLKGDFVVLFIKYFDLYNELLEQSQKTVKWNDKGKRFKASDGLIRSVLTNHHQKLMPVRKFCLLAGISTDKYYRIVKKNVDFKHRQRILNIEVLLIES